MILSMSPGRYLQLVAPAGGVVSGGFYAVGALGVLACASADEGQPFTAATSGVFPVAKPNDEAWIAGDRVFWDADAHLFTVASDAGAEVGVAASGVAEAARVGKVRFSGAAIPGDSGAGIALLDADPDPPSTGATVYFLVVDGLVQFRIQFPTGDPQIIASEDAS